MNGWVLDTSRAVYRLNATLKMCDDFLRVYYAETSERMAIAAVTVDGEFGAITTPRTVLVHRNEQKYLRFECGRSFRSPPFMPSFSRDRTDAEPVDSIETMYTERVPDEVDEQLLKKMLEQEQSLEEAIEAVHDDPPTQTEPDEESTDDVHEEGCDSCGAKLRSNTAEDLCASCVMDEHDQ